ncbi:BatA domain-containing protein [Chitinispirillales bacterium ANBcel5]|uniref:BatA domain-containing protein n=1 Tax=Cellulosispirillum alkaliphilum TaxID=3039283 RepID=UPI002A554100|nr:BatA domain-containing protein [Chitinispirillales bacterium ANBcel5]
MSFFEPLYIWGLLAIAALIAVHFLRKRKVQRLEFSTLRFFSTSAVRTSRLRNLKKILLFLARALIVIAIVALFAGIHNKDNPLHILHNPGTTVYTWIDPSISMEYVEDDFSLGERATSVLDSVLQIIPSSVLHYHYNDISGEFVLERNFNSDTYRSRFGSSGLEHAVREFKQTADENDILMLISDFQQNTLKQLESVKDILSAQSLLIAVSTAPKDPFNYSVRVHSVEEGESTVYATIYAMGKKLDSGLVTVEIDGMRVGEKNVSVEKDDSVRIAIQISPDLLQNKGKVRLFAEDPFSYDNTDFFSKSEKSNQGVLIIGNTHDNRVIASALKSARNSRWSPIVVKSGSEVTSGDIREAHLIIVNSLDEPSRPLDLLLSNKTFPEKSVLYCLDPLANDLQLLPSARQIVSQHGGQNLSELHDDNGTHPVIPDTTLGLWRGFPKTVSDNARVFRYLTNLEGRALLNTSNNNTLISSFTEPQGRRWVLCATPLGITDHNNLYQTGFYVPLIDRIARYALLSVLQEDDRWYAGVSRMNPFFGEENGAEIYTANGRMLHRWHTQPSVMIEKPGIYTLKQDGEAHKPLVVTYNPEDADFTYDSFDSEGNILFKESEQFISAISELRNNVWSFGIWILLSSLLVAELFLWGKTSTKPTSKK